MFDFTIKHLTFPATVDFSTYSKLLSILSKANLNFSTSVSSYDGYLPDREFSILHSSTPNMKMYYPEPFIATPTFVNDDIWFLHITIYQYWLWFIFISLIVFFFLGFLITLRWCNIRHRPSRETRGVSRSKCGDLITAIVPVSWAASIIIHESTDAVEFNDGFGTTDVAIGIRAYQWGWEYYYPKTLNVNLKLSESANFGNSLTPYLSSGKEDTFYSFKSAAESSDFLTKAGPSSLGQLISLTSPQASTLAADYNFGGNKLIARRANNLISSADISSIDGILDKLSDSDIGLTRFKDQFVNFVFEERFPTKPSFVNHQVSFFSSKSAFLNALQQVNCNDLTYLVSSIAGRASSLHQPTQLDFTFSRLFDSPSLEVNPVISYPTLSSIKFTKSILAAYLLTNSVSVHFTPLADQDFKRWSAFDLLEDVFWPSVEQPEGFKDLLVDNESEQQLSFSTPTLVEQGLRSFNLNISELTYPVSSFNLVFLNSPSFLTSLATYRALVFDWVRDSLQSTSWSSFKTFQALFTQDSLNLSAQLTVKGQTISLNDLTSIFSTAPLFNSTIAGVNRRQLELNLSSLTSWQALSTYFNAFWKVFKPTLAEQRSLFYFKNFSNCDSELPLTVNKVPALISAIQKNSNNSYASLTISSSISKLKPANTKLNFTPLFERFLPFPFNLAFESDSARYAWFDWYSTRNTIVTKAIDAAVFNLYASKDYNFKFNNFEGSLENVNRYDNYFFKYSNIRKFYLPISNYTPFFENTTLALPQEEFDSIPGYAGSVPKQLYLSDDINSKFILSLPIVMWTSTISPIRAYTGSVVAVHNAVDVQTNLFDILYRKEYITKTLINSVKSDKANVFFLRHDRSFHQHPITNSLRLATHYNSINSNVFKAFKFRAGLNTNYDYFTDHTIANTPKTSQYQPLRKGIVNMIRIQADKAVAMPTDTRLQILAVSKDIIHSWSIPAAGIKIDCIPGYSSHRVAVFTLSGIYWGQCMEICGRFHHWMPIVVYFMRRDLFCLWCVHFIFRNAQTNSTLQSLETAYSDNSHLVSIDAENSWFLK